MYFLIRVFLKLFIAVPVFLLLLPPPPPHTHTRNHGWIKAKCYENGRFFKKFHFLHVALCTCPVSLPPTPPLSGIDNIRESSYFKNQQHHWYQLITLVTVNIAIKNKCLFQVARSDDDNSRKHHQISFSSWLSS